MTREVLQDLVTRIESPVDLELVHEFISLPAFQRLQGITSLAFLAPPEKYQDGSSFIGFAGTRASHTLDVLRTAVPMMNECELSPHARKTLTLGILCHDIATPAGGDAVKFGRPELDEELYWADALGTDGLALVQETGIDPETVGAVIQNNGLLGDILDKADRIAYVTTDTCAYKDPQHTEEFKGLQRDIRYRADNNTTYFKDPLRLGAFLHRRVLNHRELYLHPQNRARQAMLNDFIEPMYGRQEDAPLTPHLLRRMTDYELYDAIISFHKLPFDTPQEFLGWFLNIIPEFDSLSPRSDVYKPLRARGLLPKDAIHIATERQIPINPATDYKVQSGRHIDLFKNVKPTMAREIEDLARPQDTPRYSFFITSDQVSPIL